MEGVMKRRAQLLSCSLVLAWFLVSQPSFSQTTIPSGTITTDTTWAISGSPFLVSCGGVTVAAGATLTISPGVVVRFTQSGCSGFALLGLSINGGLVANGTAAQPITFSSFTDDANSSWHGIFFNGG